MTYGMLLFAFMSYAVESAAQPAPCRQSLARLTVSRSSYAEAPVARFEHRVFIYVPAFRSRRSGFEPFRLWIVEGVYGRPFVQSAGRFDDAGFESLRKSRNVRVTAVSVVRGDGSESGRFRVAGETYQVNILKVNVSRAPNVELMICSYK